MEIIDVSKCEFYRDNYVTHMCGIDQHGACANYSNCYLDEYDDDFEEQRDWLLDIACKALTKIGEVE